MEWTDETIERLRALWAEGLSTAEIGRRMGISKNAVVGKAHRLNLPARPSPIRRDGSGAVPRAPTPLATTAATALPELSSSPPLPKPIMREPAQAAPKPAPLRPMAPRIGRSVACCWPIGEPGTASFRFCDAEATQGKPYCADHAAVAYVKVRDRREDAA